MKLLFRRRAWVRDLLAILLGALLATSARGAVLIKSAELRPSEAGYTLEATYDVGLTPTLEEALERGLSLTFVTEFELVYPRWWTFNLWNRTVSEFSTQHRLSYNALARQYRLAFGSLHQSFDTVVEALAVVGRVRFAPAVRFPEVEPGAVYLAALRLRLDTSELPKPLQIDALASNDWSLSSDWYRWTFQP
ncbi:MAG TPA: DUF4390 domain-containing protein [Burkholderiales bacterium]|nr:DUF4390 domain-containing protein [Burkholderiales bacterium]